ncbi:MAG: ribokinase [Phycisphaeraceae bacterium JB051]
MSQSTLGNVLVVGSINMDVVTPIKKLPLPGQTIMAGDVQLIPGGKGANAAVAAARLGGKVRMIGAVGDDAFGHTLKTNLINEGIDCELVPVIDGISSGTAVILLDEDSGQNSIMVSAGANAKVTASDDASVYAWANVLMMQLETPVQTNIDAARRAREAGVTVILDPAPASDALPDELFAVSDILLPNETELATLTGMDVSSIPQIMAASKALLKHGSKHVIVTLGPRGAVWVTENHNQLFAATPVKAVDTTAAGDSFAGALAANLAQGKRIADSVPFALAAGSLACTKLGAQPSVPTTEQVLAFMQQNQD